MATLSKGLFLQTRYISNINNKMLEDRSPFRKLALTEFQRQFGDLFSVKAELTDFERSIIEGTYELLWFDRHEKRDSKEWARTLRVAFHFLDKGFLTKPDKVAKSFFTSINHIAPSLNHSFLKKRKAENIKDTELDDKIDGFLSYYKTMYEGLVSVVASPVVYAFAISRKITNPLFEFQSDGRISLAAIAQMEKWLIYPQNRLAIGLNNHIRNAYSHERYRILDGGNVEIWDRNPRTKKTWGPEVWSLEDLMSICDQLWYNTQAIVCGVALFSINNRRTMIERGWAYIEESSPLRVDELKSTVEHYAAKLSFRVNEFKKENKKLLLKLSTRFKGVDQEQGIFVGTTPPRMFKMPVKHVEVRVIEQVLGLLQSLQHLLDDVNYISMSLIDPEKNDLGVVSIDYENISKIKGPKHTTVDADRSLLAVDTIGDSTMWRRDEYPVHEV
jgi:hypothetical protein